MKIIGCHASMPAVASAWLLLFAILPGTASAYPATWEFAGTVTEVGTANGTSWPSDFSVGAPLRVIVSFDTNEIFQRNSDGNAGFRYRSFGTPSLQIAVYLGTSCAPCVPTLDPAATPNNAVVVRDNYTDTPPLELGSGQYDGYGFRTISDDGTLVQVIARDFSANFDIVSYTAASGPFTPLLGQAVPNPDMASMATRLFEACTNGDCVRAQLNAVAVPDYGVSFSFTGLHCQYSDLATVADDCIRSGLPLANQPRDATVGGSAGWIDFEFTRPLAYPNPTAPTLDTLGSVFGAVGFGGPAGLPVLRGSSVPTDVGRTNSNLLAYQKYVFNGTADTDLTLVLDLGYSILSNWNNDDENIFEDQKAGGARVMTVVSVVDAEKVPQQVMAAVKNFNSLTCGNEVNLKLENGAEWPAASILGMALYTSPSSSAGPQSQTLKVESCNGTSVSSGTPVRVSPGQQFYLAASMQTPARGRWSQPGNTAPAANGYIDAANTIRVVPDPAAPPEVLQQLVQGLEPTCTTCDFTPEVVIDVKPGSSDNPINASSDGAIPVAILGSDRLNVADVNRASLTLGSLVVRRGRDGRRQCSISDINLDGLPDLVCQFQNLASNWQPGQTVVTLAGTLNNNETIFASDNIKLVP